MTPRSRLYFKFKSAFRMTTTAAGRSKLSIMGVHPIGLTVNWPSCTIAAIADGYFIDNKGNIVGTTNSKPATPKSAYITLPNLEPTTYNVKFEFSSPDILNDAP